MTGSAARGAGSASSRPCPVVGARYRVLGYRAQLGVATCKRRANHVRAYDVLKTFTFPYLQLSFIAHICMYTHSLLPIRTYGFETLLILAN